MSTPDILVIGGNGQLGRDCLSVLRERAAGMDIPEIDITNRDRLMGTLDKRPHRVIVNCAAYTAVDACENDPLCWRVNADGPKYLAEWATANQAFLIHISTDYVFDGTKPLFTTYTETDPPAPISEYGRSKLAGEHAVIGSGARAAVLRTAWLYGTYGKNFLKTILRLTLTNQGRALRVVNDQFGSPTWSYTLAEQIAAIVHAQAAGLFHATSEGYCSWFDLASRFLRLMDVPHRIAPCTTAEYPTPARRPRNSILENAALKARGLNVFRTWETDLDLFVRANRATLLAETNKEGAR